jgi:hypothetical protein
MHACLATAPGSCGRSLPRHAPYLCPVASRARGCAGDPPRDSGAPSSLPGSSVRCQAWIASACLSHAGSNAIQTWGFTDKYSWIGSKTKGGKGAALLFDRKYAPKPADQALKNALTTGERAAVTAPVP